MKDPETGKEKHPDLELVRLAIPQRVYTNNYMDYVAEKVLFLYQRRKQIKGLKVVYEAPVLRHFTMRFAPTD